MPCGIRSDQNYQFQINSMPLKILQFESKPGYAKIDIEIYFSISSLSVVHLKLNLYVIWKFFQSIAHLYELAVKKKESKPWWKDWLLLLTICKIWKKLALLNAVIQKETVSKNYFPCAWSKLYRKSNLSVMMSEVKDACKQYFRIILKP